MIPFPLRVIPERHEMNPLLIPGHGGFWSSLMFSIILKRIAVVLALVPVIAGSAAMLIIPRILEAQSLVSGDIAGTVTDSTGAAIPNAKVRASNTGTGQVKEVTASAAGNYRISLLQPGKYTVTATADGFETTKGSLDLSIGQVANQKTADRLDHGRPQVRQQHVGFLH